MEKVVDLTVDSTRTSTNDPWKDLDTLLCRIAAIREYLSTNEFVEIDAETSVFNEWKNTENLSPVEDVRHNQSYKDTGIIEEQSLAIIGSFGMVRKLHLLACACESELHWFVVASKSKPVDNYVDGNDKKRAQSKRNSRNFIIYEVIENKLGWKKLLIDKSAISEKSKY